MAKKQRRGFAVMDPALQRAIASRGGKVASGPNGRGHKFTSAQAKVAGRKGGLAFHAKRADRLHGVVKGE